MVQQQAQGEPRHLLSNVPEVQARLVGQVLAGRYRIDSVLAGGATGHVYKATQVAFDRAVAIKVLYCEDDDDATQRFRRRFEREAAIAAQLAHPNIVTILDFGETDEGDVFIAMEFLEGQPLYMALQEQGRFSTQRALNIALQVTRALRRAHGMGVVHRDLKPANIMVRPDGDGLDMVTVLDFGLVKVFDSDTEEGLDGIEEENLTSAGALMGTPGYMAPEQAVGDQIDGRADLYAVGIILTQMLTGRLPFEGNSIVELITAQVMQPVPFVRELEPELEISDELEATVHRCLNKDRDERPESAEALLQELKEAWLQETEHSFGTEASMKPGLLDSVPDTVRSKIPQIGASAKIHEAELPVVPLLDDPLEEPPSATGNTSTKEIMIPTASRRAWLWLSLVAIVVVMAAGAAVKVIVQPRLQARARPVGGLVDLPESSWETAPAAVAPAPTPPAPRVVPAPVPNKSKPQEEDYKGNPF